MSIIQFPAEARLSEAYRALIAAGKERFRSLFDKEQKFENMVWDIRGLADRAIIRNHPQLHFTKYQTLDQPLPAIYGDAVKSWLLLSPYSNIRSLIPKLDMARMLWQAIAERRKLQQDEFLFESLCEEDLSQAEQLMMERLAPSTAHKSATRMIGFAKFLAERKLCHPLYYTTQTQRIEDTNRHTIAGQEEKMAMLPSQQTLEGLADIYRELAIDPPDRLRICLLAILAVTGFRISELLTLPLDCEVKEVRGNNPRYGLRYYKEKARGGERMFAVRWLSGTGAELAQAAITEIRTITQPFREQAKILESAIELNEISTSKLWTLDRRNGTYQMFSESLVIVPRNFFHSRKATKPSIIEAVNFQHISDFLSGRTSSRGTTKSVFERFEIREENGEFCTMHSHQLRHWLNTIAEKGGLPMEMLTRWMGRENPRDTGAYRHLSMDERIAWLKSGIRKKEVGGLLADVYHTLSEEEGDAFLAAQIQAVHFTPLGVCIHDFAVMPCEFHISCVRGCSDYLRTKGNQKERMALIQLERNTRNALAAIPNTQVAAPWRQHNEAVIVGIQAALAIDNDETIPDGTTKSPYEAGNTHFTSGA